MVKHVVWDMGGTLIDTYPSIDRLLLDTVSAALQARSGVRAPVADLPSLQDIARLTRGGIARAIGILAERYGIDPQATEAAHQRMKDSWQTVTPPPVMEGAAEALAAVRERGGLNLIVTHRDRASAELLLARTGLEVEDMICQPDGYARKPDPQMYNIMLARHKLRPEECLAVGDRTIDALAGARAGLVPVLLETPGLPLDEVDLEALSPADAAEASTLLARTPRIFTLREIASL